MKNKDVYRGPNIEDDYDGLEAANDGLFKQQNANANQNKDPEDKDDFTWKSPGQHIIYFIMYLMDWDSLFLLAYEDGMAELDYEPTVAHYAVMLVVCAAPLIYLQTFIGQYSKSGYLAFGMMLPLAYGIGFMMMVFTFFQLTGHVYYSSLLIEYFFFALWNRVPAWVICYKTVPYPIECFSREDFDLCATTEYSNEPCFQPGTRILSSVYFMRSTGIFGGKTEHAIEVLSMDMPVQFTYGVFHLVFTFFAMLFAGTRSFKNLDVAFRISFYLCVVGLSTLSLIAFTQPEGIQGLGVIFSSVTKKSLFDYETWMAAFRRTIQTLKIAEGGLVVFGSCMRPSDKCPQQSFFLTCAYGLAALYFLTYLNIFSGLLTFKLNLSPKDLLLDSEESTIFAMYPIVLGIQANGYFFCIIFFLIINMISICSLVLKVVMLEKSMSFQFNIGTYYGYSRVFICMTSMTVLITTFFIMNGDIFFSFKGHLKQIMFVITCIQLIIVHLYGLQRFCDDIQFFSHSKVPTFFKVCWIVIPLFCLIGSQGAHRYKNLISHDTLTFFFLLMLFSIPVIAASLYIIIVFAKNKNLIGLLRPMDKYGPPDIQIRIYRLLYNPRLSEKYMIQSAECNHKCLYNSSAMNEAIGDEISLINKLILELENSREESSKSDNYSEIISRLQEHLRILLDRPK